MFLFVGLGNPGPKYAGNRHNVGFMAVDRLAARAKADAYREKFNALLAKATVAGEEAVLLKPLTYMNLSGESVQRAMTFFKVPLANVIVLHDELDVPFGQYRLKSGGGAAGHNGLRSIIQQCGGADFQRIRLGIGRPVHGTVESFVLSDFSPIERAELETVLEGASLISEAIVSKGLAAAMNRFNTRAK